MQQSDIIILWAFGVLSMACDNLSEQMIIVSGHTHNWSRRATGLQGEQPLVN